MSQQRRGGAPPLLARGMRAALALAMLALYGALAAQPSVGDTVPIAQGAALVETRFCRACHRIGGEGMEVGPDLNQVSLRRSQEWLRRWLKDPAAVKPGTIMPFYSWTDAEIDSVIAYLAQYRKPVDGAAILAAAGAGATGGEALIEAYDCAACHAVRGLAGRPIYPDLHTVRERRTAEWERDWLQNPQAVKPGTFMPTFGLSRSEIEAIIAYLYR